MENLLEIDGHEIKLSDYTFQTRFRNIKAKMEAEGSEVPEDFEDEEDFEDPEDEEDEGDGGFGKDGLGIMLGIFWIMRMMMRMMMRVRGLGMM